MKVMSTPAKWLIVAAILAIGAVGARAQAPSGLSAASTAAQILAYQGPDRAALFYKLAQERKEKLVWYSNYSYTDDIVKAFKAKYPNVRVEAYFSGTENATKIAQEYAGRRYIFDVYTDTLGRIDRNATYFSPLKNVYSAQYISNTSGEYWAVTSGYASSYAYNASLVAAADLPQSWQALGDPKWKGKILASTTSDITLLMSVVRQAAGDDVVKKIADNSVVQDTNTTATLNLVAAGQYAIALAGPSSVTAQLAAKGLPIKWTPMKPTLISWVGLSVAKNPPNPAAAALFADWMLDPNGGQAFMATKFSSSPLVGKRLVPFDYLPADLKIDTVDPSTQPNYSNDVLPKSIEYFRDVFIRR